MAGIKFYKAPRLGLKNSRRKYLSDGDNNLGLKPSTSIQKIEGPFDNNGKLVEYVSRTHEYTYRVKLNKKISQNEIYNIKWAVSYDDAKNTESFYLFSGGRLKNQEIEVKIQISKGNDGFKIYAYYGDLPENNFTEVKYKKTVAFFIGGAADKEAYYGQGPTNIILDEVKTHFDRRVPPQDYSSHHLGYNEAYKNKINTIVKSKIPNKEGTSINIIGHSLGGWNGAHLSQILTDQGYNIDLLVTLDPVGLGSTVTYISNIYWGSPKPKSEYWVNLYTDPESWTQDDYVAWFGEQWQPNKDKVSIYEEVNIHHGEAGKMFRYKLKETKITPSDFLVHFINLYLTTK